MDICTMDIEVSKVVNAFKCTKKVLVDWSYGVPPELLQSIVATMNVNHLLIVGDYDWGTGAKTVLYENVGSENYLFNADLIVVNDCDRSHGIGFDNVRKLVDVNILNITSKMNWSNTSDALAYGFLASTITLMDMVKRKWIAEYDVVTVEVDIMYALTHMSVGCDFDTYAVISAVAATVQKSDVTFWTDKYDMSMYAAATSISEFDHGKDDVRYSTIVMMKKMDNRIWRNSCGKKYVIVLPYCRGSNKLDFYNMVETVKEIGGGARQIISKRISHNGVDSHIDATQVVKNIRSSRLQFRYDEMRKTNRKQCIDTFKKYQDSKHFIKQPQVVFERIWISWYHFFGVDTSGFIPTLAEFRRRCAKISSKKEYDLLASTEPEFPPEPGYFYIGWKGMQYEFNRSALLWIQ